MSSQLKSVHDNDFDTKGLATRNKDIAHGYRLSVSEYPTGDVEVTAIKFDADTRFGNKSCKKRKNDKKSEMTDEVLKKSQNRSKKLVRKKALVMQADRMLTLTFKENVTDLEEAWICLKYFHKLMRQRYQEKYLFIAVPEFQKRGAVHFHLAVKGYYHANTVRKLWQRAAGTKGGNIDITSPRQYNFNSWNPKRISAYLSKYITKNDSVGFNSKRYSSSTNLKPPLPVIMYIALGICIRRESEKIIERITHLPVTTFWQNDKYFNVTFLST